MDAQQLSLFQRTIGAGWTEDEKQLFLLTCNRLDLDPFARYLYLARERGTFRIESTIDGFRFAAERTGKYSGQIGPHWCGPDGKWLNVWTSDQPPHAARVGILRSDFTKPIWGKALFSEFQQQGEFWRDMPANQLAKCAEALGFRKAFPVLSGLYTNDEMPQAQACRGAVAASANQLSETGDDPATLLDSVGDLHGPSSEGPSVSPRGGEPRDSEHGGAQPQTVPAVPLPLQPFAEQPMTRRNIQAAFGFIQAELERTLGPEGTAIFRRLWTQLPRTFRTKEEARLKTVACWCEMWAYVESADYKREAA